MDRSHAMDAVAVDRMGRYSDISPRQSTDQARLCVSRSLTRVEQKKIILVDVEGERVDRGLINAVVMVCFLACTGCRWGENDSEKGALKRPEAYGTRSPDTDRSTGVASTPPSAGQVLRFPDPDDGPHKPWLRYSAVGDNINGGNTTYEIPGDSYSKYYEVISYSGDGSNDTSIYDDKGKSIAYIGYYADLVGIRKTNKTITVYAYFDTGNDDQSDYENLGSYQIGQVEGGHVRHYACYIDQTTFDRVAGRHFGSKAERQSAAVKLDPKVVDLLTSAEPALERDHCKYIAPYEGQS